MFPDRLEKNSAVFRAVFRDGACVSRACGSPGKYATLRCLPGSVFYVYLFALSTANVIVILTASVRAPPRLPAR